MKLSTKLSLSLSLAFVGIVLVGLFSLYLMNSINKKSTEISKTWIPSMIIAQHLNTLASEFRRHEINLVYNENSSITDFHKNKMREIIDEININLIKYKSIISLPEELKNFQDMQEIWYQYLLTNQRLEKLSRARRTSEATDLLLSKSLDLFETFSATLTKILAIDVRMGEKSSVESDKMYANATLLTIIMLLTSLGIIVVLGGSLVRNTLRNLGKDPAELGALARRVAEGDLDIPKDAKAMGVYADILVMVEKLKEHITSIENLTSNIPGGVQTCLLDEEVTILYLSEGIIDLFGYNRRELKELFNNRHSRMLHPEDCPKAMAALAKQLAAGDTFELEYRIPHKDGHDVWVLDRGRRAFDAQGRAFIYCVLIDITELKITQMYLKFQEEQCRAALCATHTFLFECDGRDRFILHKGLKEWLTIYERLPAGYDDLVKQSLLQCHPDDCEAFSRTFSAERIIETTRDGAQTLSLEYRIRGLNNEYQWFHCTLVPFTTMEGNITKVFGCVANINDRKQHEFKILYSAQRDSLTGLYNKGYSEQEIAHFLAGAGKDGTHALMVVDIDNFKSINDNLGHLFGDAVLADVSASIKKTFRSSDITGRIGGDEFIILLKNLNDALLTRKAAEICTSFQRTFSGESRDYALSGSIGIAMYPKDGASYRELFKKADIALYTAKSKGKSQYCRYDETTEHRS